MLAPFAATLIAAPMLAIGAELSRRPLLLAGALQDPGAFAIAIGNAIVVTLPLALPLAILVGAATSAAKLGMRGEMAALDALGISRLRLLAILMPPAIAAALLGILLGSHEPASRRALLQAIARLEISGRMHAIERIGGQELVHVGTTVALARDIRISSRGERIVLQARDVSLAGSGEARIGTLELTLDGPAIAPESDVRAATRAHRRSAVPLTALAMVPLALALGRTSSRKAAPILAVLAIVAAGFLLHRAFDRAVDARAIPPIVAAYAPPFLMSIVALAWLRRS